MSINKRIIKNDKEIINIPTNSDIIHPTTLEKYRKGTNSCLINLDLSKDGKHKLPYKCINQNNKDKYMFIPPIGLNSSDILVIYNINSIDDLNQWLENKFNNEEINFYTINRVLNCWIKTNMDILKNYNNFLEKIYNNLINKYINDENIKITNLEKETKYYIDYWINKNKKSTDNFDFNLLDDYINYINKKFK